MKNLELSFLVSDRKAKLAFKFIRVKLQVQEQATILLYLNKKAIA